MSKLKLVVSLVILIIIICFLHLFQYIQPKIEMHESSMLLPTQFISMINPDDGAEIVSIRSTNSSTLGTEYHLDDNERTQLFELMSEWTWKSKKPHVFESIADVEIIFKSDNHYDYYAQFYGDDKQLFIKYNEEYRYYYLNKRNYSSLSNFIETILSE